MDLVQNDLSLAIDKTTRLFELDGECTVDAIKSESHVLLSTRSYILWKFII